MNFTQKSLLLTVSAGYLALANEIPHLIDEKNVGGPVHWIGKKVLDELMCKACAKTTNMVSDLLSRQGLQDDVEKLCVAVCIGFDMAYPSELICPGMVPEMTDPLFTILTEYLLNKERMCGEFFGVCDHPKYVTETIEDYQSRVLAYKPAIIQNDDYVNNLYAKIHADLNPRPTLKMVHMSDPHYDDEYAVGTLNKCNSYMCCREYWGYPEDPALQAGKFGGYECDIPWITLESMFQHIKDVEKPDLFVWTGDNSPHSDWTTTTDSIKESTRVITDAIKRIFEGVDMPIYPSPGNHDTWPVDQEDFNKGPDADADIDAFTHMWQDWIGEEAAAMMINYGYFVTDLKLPGGRVVKGGKVISLNTQAWNPGNWYNLGSKYDPANEMTWLEETLYNIEAISGFAIIIGHIQPYNFQDQAGSRFQALMERYQHIVRFSMYGHTHLQVGTVTQSITHPEKTIGFSQIGPSVTTNTNVNPGYAVLELDEATMLPLNWKIYKLDIEKANASGVAEWELSVDYVNDYQLGQMSPDSLYNLAKRMTEDDGKLLHKYQWDESRQYGELKTEPATANAMHSQFCKMTASTRSEWFKCTGGAEKLKDKVTDWVIGDWKKPA